MPEIAAFSFLPAVCPKCERKLSQDRLSAEDFFAGASCECKCGLSYAYVPPVALLKACGEHGDMLRYVFPEGVSNA